MSTLATIEELPASYRQGLSQKNSRGALAFDAGGTAARQA